jgi:hypothetical protein
VPWSTAHYTMRVLISSRPSADGDGGRGRENANGELSLFKAWRRGMAGLSTHLVACGRVGQRAYLVDIECYKLGIEILGFDMCCISPTKHDTCHGHNHGHTAPERGGCEPPGSPMDACIDTCVVRVLPVGIADPAVLVAAARALHVVTASVLPYPHVALWAGAHSAVAADGFEPFGVRRIFSVRSTAQEREAMGWPSAAEAAFRPAAWTCECRGVWRLADNELSAVRSGTPSRQWVLLVLHALQHVFVPLEAVAVDDAHQVAMVEAALALDHRTVELVCSSRKAH